MKGIVYQIYLESNPDIHYVGSTTKTLEQRWRHHKNDFQKKTIGRPSICNYFEQFGIDNFKIRFIKEYDIVDRNHLLAYEQLWINRLKPVNIKKNLFPTKHLILEQKKTYREQNKEYQKTYRENHIEQIKEYKKTYRENHIEQIKEYKKTYYENNKKKARQYYENNIKKNKYICPCEPDKELLLTYKSKHEKTLKHQKYLQTLEETKE